MKTFFILFCNIVTIMYSSITVYYSIETYHNYILSFGEDLPMLLGIIRIPFWIIKLIAIGCDDFDIGIGQFFIRGIIISFGIALAIYIAF